MPFSLTHAQICELRHARVGKHANAFLHAGHAEAVRLLFTLQEQLHPVAGA
jgi:hypothetical protein